MNHRPVSFPNWKEVLANATFSPQIKRAYTRSVQELLGHASAETTQIYTHVMKKPRLGVRSPLDQ